MSTQEAAKKKGISLKYKLLGLLIVIPVISLALYLLLATRLFESDKIAYVYDASLLTSRGVAGQVKTKVEALAAMAQPLIEGFDTASNKFSPASIQTFHRDTTLDTLSVFPLGSIERWNAAAVSISQTESSELTSKDFSERYKPVVQESWNQQIAILIPEESQDHLAVAMSGKWVGNLGKGWGALCVYQIDDLARLFGSGGIYVQYLINSSGSVIAGQKKIKSFEKWKFFSDLKKKNLPEGVSEVVSPEGETLLASFSGVGLGDLRVITLVKKAEALKAVDVLLWKSILFFIALISFSVIASVLASSKLTSSLNELYQATQKVSEGHFDIRVAVKTGDEIGSLAESFNAMAGEVSRLMSATADKARMEKELETAKTVQETLFPSPQFRLGPFQLAGYYQPASECGGDWWHHCVIGDKIYLWIGDATGHGASAALITSAAKSASSIIERLSDITPSLAMNLLNNAIYETSKGGILMTFFIACFDRKTRQLSYCNASHEPPLLVRRKGNAPLSRKDLEPLNEVNNPRLGETKDVEFAETSIQLQPGDFIFFYTDGVPDMKNPEGAAWGEKNFFRTVLATLETSPPLADAIESVRKQAEDHRKGAELPDDVTFFLCQFDKTA